MTAATAQQWVLLGGFTAMLAWAFLVGWRLPRLRPLCAALGLLAATHAGYYWLFLVWPDVLDAAATRQFSIVIRYQVLFTMALAMALAVRRGRWR